MLAYSKLNTVHSHISKALNGNNIRDKYKLVLDDVEKFFNMKDKFLECGHMAKSILTKKKKMSLSGLAKRRPASHSSRGLCDVSMTSR